MSQNSDRRIALTRSQLLMWLGMQKSENEPLYNMAELLHVDGLVDYERLVAAFRQVVANSDALRMAVRVVDGEPVGVVREAIAFEFPLVDVSNNPDSKAAARRWAAKRCRVPLDVEHLPFECALLKRDERAYTWYLNIHHLVTDAWSTGLVFARTADLYQKGALHHATTSWPQYADYSSFESEERKGSRAEKVRGYWEERTQTAAPLKFYGRSPHPTATSSTRYVVNIDKKTSDEIRKLATDSRYRALSQHLSVYNVFVTLLTSLLVRVSDRRAIRIGTFAHNRPTPAFKETIGLFVSVFPLSLEVVDGETFTSLLRKVRDETTGFVRHALPGASGPAENRAFNVLLNYINASNASFGGLATSSEWIHSGHSDPHHDMRLQVHDLDESGEFTLHFDLRDSVFDAKRADRLLQHAQALLRAFLKNPDQSIEGVEILTDEEKRLVLPVNSAQREARELPTVVEMIKETVRSSPDAAAIVYGDEVISYRELDSMSDRVARALHERGLGDGDLVGLYVRRSPEMVAAFVGILKAGCACVPIDARYPRHRAEVTLTSCDAAACLVHGTEAPLVAAKSISIEDVWTAGTAHPDHGLPMARKLAYVMYTSGSTGEPKGVAVAHRALSNYVSWARANYGVVRGTRFPLFTSVSFDLTITSIFVPLAAGGTVIVYPEDSAEGDLLVRQVAEDERVDIMKLTPSHLSAIEDLERIAASTLILGGENLTVPLARDALARMPRGGVLHNEYGPTEATVGCMVHRFDPMTDASASVPIGSAIENAYVRVLNAARQPVPPGVTGELYVGGAGLAEGYYGDAALTSTKFIPDPLFPSETLYATGDSARVREDGIVEYLGRNDGQLKIRGVRVEKGEVEAVLRGHPDVTGCYVAAQSVGRTRSPHPAPESFCVDCGLSSRYPGATFDDAGRCAICRTFDRYRDRTEAYFSDLSQFKRRILSRRRTGEFDCLMMYSGGKDSTYALYQLVDMGLRVMTFTLDNGYISDYAKSNIARVVTDLGVTHVYGSTPHMNEIFRDSLRRHSNVCQGCYKTIYTLAIREARTRGIPFIVTGLSRGQFFETRLSEELFCNPEIQVDDIDAVVLAARKAYHRTDDSVARLLETTDLRDDGVFTQVEFIDFYRYCDVELSEIFDFLERRSPWIRPADTGRSTNCLINDVGIHVHKLERGFHNYALPYSWDVRLGHKTRDEAIEELNDDIDAAQVQQIIDELAYKPERSSYQDVRLAVYFTANEKLDATGLRGWLAERLPAHSVPSLLVQLEKIPLNSNGKVDETRLPRPEVRETTAETPFVAPATERERAVAEIWQEVLGIDRVGSRDNFFELGGDSLLAIQVSSIAARRGLRLSPADIFSSPSVAGLASVAESGPKGTRKAHKGSAVAELDEHRLNQLAAALQKIDDAGGADL